MDVRNQRHGGGLDNGLERSGRSFIGTGDPHDINPGLLTTPDLANRGTGIRSQRIGHGLDADRGIATDFQLSDPDRAALAPVNHAPGAHGTGIVGTFRDDGRHGGLR